MQFLKEQSTNEYKNLDVLVDIHTDKDISALRKFFTIIAGLRACGLYEEGYEPNEDTPNSDDEAGRIEELYQMQILECKLIKGSVEFYWILN